MTIFMLIITSKVTVLDAYFVRINTLLYTLIYYRVGTKKPAFPPANILLPA